MADPRNIAHDKKTQDEKKHHGEEIAPGAAEVPQPGKKPPMIKDEVEVEGHPHPHHRKENNPTV